MKKLLTMFLGLALAGAAFSTEFGIRADVSSGALTWPLESTFKSANHLAIGVDVQAHSSVLDNLGASANLSISGTTLTVGNGTTGTIVLGDSTISKSSGGGFVFGSIITAASDPNNAVIARSGELGTGMYFPGSNITGFINGNGGTESGRFSHSGGLSIGTTTDAGTGNVLVSGTVTINSATILKSGSGSPESVVTAPVGSVFFRTDGGSSTTLYVKESGSGNTGWVAHGAGGGGGAPALPTWTFSASDNSDPAAGNLTSDNANPTLITALNLSTKVKGATADLTAYLAGIRGGSAYIVLTSSTGDVLVYTFSGASPFTDYVAFTVTNISGDASSFSGDYQVSFMPTNSLALSSDVTIDLATMNSGLTPAADGTYNFFNDGTSGNVTSITITKGIVTGVTVAP